MVSDPDGRTCGILSFGHILRNHDNDEEIAEIVACVTGRKNIFEAKKTLSEAVLRTH